MLNHKCTDQYSDNILQRLNQVLLRTLSVQDQRTQRNRVRTNNKHWTEGEARAGRKFCLLFINLRIYLNDKELWLRDYYVNVQRETGLIELRALEHQHCMIKSVKSVFNKLILFHFNIKKEISFTVLCLFISRSKRNGIILINIQNHTRLL